MAGTQPLQSPRAEPRLLTWPERQWRGLVLAGWPVALLGAAPLLSLGDVPLCGFRHVTGIPCPLCGGTRVCAALAQGDFQAAWQLNAGLVVVLAIAAVHSVQLAAEAGSGLRWRRWRVGAGVWRAGLAVLLVSWIARLL